MHDAEAVKQILAKSAVGHFFRQIPVGCGHDAHVDGNGFLAPERPNLAVFQNAQQLDLEVGLHLTDFIKKQGSIVRQFKTTPATPGRTGERARFVSKQLALDEFLRQRPAVD